MEFFLIATVVVLWWKLALARRRSREAALIFQAMSHFSVAVQGTLTANSDGYAYWYLGSTLVRSPLVNGVADRGHVEPADPATCPDLTADDAASIASALKHAADDLLHDRRDLT